MNVKAIKALVKNYKIEALKEAEERIMEGEDPGIEIEGEDEGEQLTHAIAAIWILEDMAENDRKFAESLREFTHKVRASISTEDEDEEA